MAVKLAFLPPAEAVDYLKGKGFAVSFDWQDVYAEEHARVFTVAKMLRLDLLELVHAEVLRSVAEGRSLRQFKDALIPTLQREGWWGRQELPDPATGEIKNVQLGSPRRLEIIYDTNLRTAYSAGRWVRAQRSARRLPLLLYRTMQDARVRPAHRAWDGVALPLGDTFWDTHYPPNGWRCRCIAYPISDADLGRLQKAYDDSDGRRGVDIKRQAPAVETIEWSNPRTGEIRQIPVGIDPGFDYNPGTGALKRALAQRAERQAASSVVPRRTLEEVRQAGIEYVLKEGRARQAAKIEFAYVYDGLGNVLIQKQGVRSEVPFSAEEMALLVAADRPVLIHNHPSGGSLSPADLRMAARLAGGEVVAVGHNDVVYSVKVRDPTRFRANYDAVDHTVFRVLLARVQAGGIDPDWASSQHYHVVNLILQRIGIIDYGVADSANVLALPSEVRDLIEQLAERFR